MCRPGRGAWAADLGLHRAPPTCGDTHQLGTSWVDAGASREFCGRCAAARDNRGIAIGPAESDLSHTESHLCRAEPHVRRAESDRESGPPGRSDRGSPLRSH